MQDRSARLFSGLGVLVIVWIVVYWLFPVGEPTVSTSPMEYDDIELPGGETKGAVPGPVVIDQSEGVSRPGRAPARGTGEPGAGPGRSAVGSDRASGGNPGGVVPPEFVDYIIKPGDMGWEKISERVYGTRAHWSAVSRANPLLDPRKLRIGEVIRVPVDPENVQGLPVEPGDEEGESEPEPAPTPAEIEYTVQPGDSLSRIATQFYGSIRYVDFLYDANRDRLRSKDDLRVGQVLVIPPMPAGGEG